MYGPRGGRSRTRIAPAPRLPAGGVFWLQTRMAPKAGEAADVCSRCTRIGSSLAGFDRLLGFASQPSFEAGRAHELLLPPAAPPFGPAALLNTPKNA